MTSRSRELTGPPPRTPRGQRARAMTCRLRGMAGPAGALACLATVAWLAFGFQIRGPEGPAVPAEAPTVAAHPPVPREYPLPPGSGPEHPGGADPTERGLSATLGLPRQVVEAYLRAEKLMAERDPGCRLHWSVLAGIGRIESGHARGGALKADGTTITPILGPRLDGTLADTAVVRDTTDGRYDGDAAYERAVGPMQFLPGTWLNFGQDGNNDGNRDPHNIYDAALASATYLCAGDRDLSQRTHLEQAVFSYNPSWPYVRAVLAWADAYAAGRGQVSDSVAALAAGASWANRGALGSRTRLPIPPTASTLPSSSPTTTTAEPRPAAPGAPPGTTSSSPPATTPDRDPAHPTEQPEAPPSCGPTTRPSQSSESPEPSETPTTPETSQPSEPPTTTETSEPPETSSSSEPPPDTTSSTPPTSTTEPPSNCAGTASDAGSP